MKKSAETGITAVQQIIFCSVGLYHGQVAETFTAKNFLTIVPSLSLTFMQMS